MLVRRCDDKIPCFLEFMLYICSLYHLSFDIVKVFFLQYSAYFATWQVRVCFVTRFESSKTAVLAVLFLQVHNVSKLCLCCCIRCITIRELLMFQLYLLRGVVISFKCENFFVQAKVGKVKSYFVNLF